jgi:thymidylate synthase
MQIIRSNFTHLWNNSIEQILDGNGIEASPRGMKTTAVLSSVLELTNPRDRMLFNKHRKYSLPYAIGEFFWYMSGYNFLNMIEYYAPSMKNYSNDNKTLNSGYGKKIFNNSRVNQFEYAYNKLVQDKNTRQSVILIRGIEDTIDDIKLDFKSKDIPCTFYLHFQIIKNKLFCTISMRSQDLFVGACYDFFCFSMLHEYMLLNLKNKYKDLQLGSLIIHQDNLHIYSKWYDVARNIIEDKSSLYSLEMPHMVRTDMNEILDMEISIRQGGLLDYEDMNNIPKYWRDLLNILRWYKTKNVTYLKNVNACYIDNLKISGLLI